MSSCERTISLNDIYNFPFPHKLWIAINSVTCEFIKWNTDGTHIEVKLLALDNYLSSPQSIFKIQSRSSFVAHLRDDYAFKLINTQLQSSTSNTSALSGPVYSEIVMHFSHMCFLRHRIDLLANIRKTSNATSPIVGGKERQTFSTASGNRLEGDLCNRSFGSISPVSKAHFKHQLILKFISETKNLERKLKASEMASKAKSQEGNEEDSIIELPADIYENPHDSVLYMGDEHRTDYAGFYGNCTKEQVLKFFGPYLPMYENSNNDDGEKRIVNLNPTGQPSPQAKAFELDLSFNEESTMPSDVITQDVPGPTAISSLEPIFLPDKEKDESIQMDEFIKFKEQTEKQESVVSVQETDIKVEESDRQEDDENEANFKSFFSQYRESLSLLYEKQ